MQKKVLFGLAVFAAPAVIWAVCAPPPPPPLPPPEPAKVEKVFRFSIGADPRTIDFNRAYENAGSRVVESIGEGLIWYYQSTLKPEPGVATAWPITTLPDGTAEVTFVLRNNARWWGKPLKTPQTVTAHDFVNAWRRLTDPQNASQYLMLPQQFGLVGADEYFKAMDPIQKLRAERDEAEQAQDGAKVQLIEQQILATTKSLETTTLPALRANLGFRADGDFKFVVHVKNRGYADILLQLAGFTPLFPIHQPTIDLNKARGTAWTDENNIVTNGPYLLKTYVVRGYFELVKNPYWWNAANVAFDRVFLYTSDDGNAMLRRYENPNPDDSLDMVDTIPAEQIEPWRGKPDLRIAPQFANYFYSFNTTKPPFNNVHVRRAICRAIDRVTIVEKVTKGGQKPIASLIPSLPDGSYIAITDGLDFDPKKAREELRLAGYTVDEKLTPNDPGAFDIIPHIVVTTAGFPPFSLKYNTNEGHQAIGEAVQTMLRANLGISMSLQNQPWPSFLADREAGNYDIARNGWIGDFTHPATLSDILRSDSPHNDSRWRSPRYDDLNSRAMLGTPAEARQLYQEADRLIVEDAPICPIYVYSTVRLVKSHIRGCDDNLRDYHPVWQLSLAQ